ncbi:MAG: hypothetical protein ACI90V_009601, partial [Bacillariaceae sp.]
SILSVGGTPLRVSNSSLPLREELPEDRMQLVVSFVVAS